MTSTPTLHRGYVSALEQHLAQEGEASLLAAYELGRELISREVGLLDVVRIHADAVNELQQRQRTDPHRSRRAEDFLVEVLAPFEMAYLGFQEANTTLRRLTASLETQVEERTHELQDSLSRLQALDAERRRLLKQVVSAQEDERHRIADDLHDDTIQVMAAVALRLSTLSSRVPEADRPLLERLEGTVSDAIGRLRRLVFELRPPELDQAGLAAAIRLYLQTTFDDGPDYTVEDRLEDQLPIDVRETAYRITQEALANVRRHANADSVSVTVTTTSGDLHTRIEDDGNGFNPDQLPNMRPGHLGIPAMRERAQMTGGELHITSRPGSGTRVEFSVPITNRD